MNIVARVVNRPGGHEVSVSTDGTRRPLKIEAKETGRGSSMNGGELLMAALATCYCNDVFREAAALGIDVRDVEVEAEADFGGIGLPASAVRYRVRITGDAPEAALRELADRTDRVAEIQNTLRQAIPVTLEAVEITRRE